MKRSDADKKTEMMRSNFTPNKTTKKSSLSSLLLEKKDKKMHLELGKGR
jgi:hypothetical protein